MKKSPALLCLLLISAAVLSLFAQGYNFKATKDDWEEINFEFNSSVLSDGYPGLLRLAELLQKHPGFKVKVEGHTDFVGSENYNNKLALARASAVRDFLVKYGASANQIETSGRGKGNPEVNNSSKEGRFMNRRVVLTVIGEQGKQVSAGGVGEAIKAIEPPPPPAPPPPPKPDCCDEIKQKLDDILAALKDLKGDQDRLKQEVADLRARPQPEPPKPVDKNELSQMMGEAATKAVDAGKTKKFTVLGLNVGPDTRQGNITFTGKGRFFAPLNGHQAFQAEGEYLYYRDRQEGQFDFGLVNRVSSFQAGLFSTFKHVNFREFQQGGTLGQGALTLDYVFNRGRVGAFGTKGFLNNAVVNRGVLSRNVIEETYLRIVDQVGGSALVGLWGDSYLEGNLGALFRKGGGNRPGGTIRFVQPVSPHWAFTLEGGFNETLIGRTDSGRIVFGVQLGNWMRPKEYAEVKHPVPVDIPRLRYELLTRRIRTGNDPPVADAGPDQLGVLAGTKTLDGSGSFDPDGDPITFEWTQIAGPAVTLSNSKSARTTFEAAAGQGYSFRLSVRDDQGGMGTAKVTVMTAAAPQVRIVRFTANPPQIRAGGSTTIAWEVQDADEVTIDPLLGRVNARSGVSTVTLNETTTFRINARNRTSEVSETLVVTVERLDVRILSFQASPATIKPGESSTLSWQTENADEVSISGIGAVRPNGTASVSPAQTTIYTLTARNRFGTVNATATVQVSTVPAPRIIRFAANPPEIASGEQSTLVWEVENATDITITDIGKAQATGTSAVTPADTKTYTLTAKNAQGEVSATAVVTVLQPVKILNFVADPPVFKKPGDPITLRWTTTNATEVVITGVGNVPVNGSVVVRPTSAVSYSLVAYGKRSQATALVLVKQDPSFVNRPPVAIPGPDRVVQNEDVNLDGSKSYDPDGDPITFSWRYLGDNPEVMVINPTSAVAKAWMPGPGVFTFQLTVTDTKGASTSAPVTLTFRR